jgi:hypothetical protein
VTLLELRTELLRRLDAPTDGSGQWTAAEANLALNRAQAMFAALTLCLRKTGTATVTTSAELALQTAFPGWLAPFRASIDGERVYPANVSRLSARYADWLTSTDATRRWRYLLLGVNYMRLAPVPAASKTLAADYAGSPATLSADGNIPEIPAENHADLIDYAFWRLRWKGSGGEVSAASAGLTRFLDAAKKRALLVRGMVRAESLDTTPPELDRLTWPSLPKTA